MTENNTKKSIYIIILRNSKNSVQNITTEQNNSHLKPIYYY